MVWVFRYISWLLLDYPSLFPLEQKQQHCKMSWHLGLWQMSWHLSDICRTFLTFVDISDIYWHYAIFLHELNQIGWVTTQTITTLTTSSSFDECATPETNALQRGIHGSPHRHGWPSHFPACQLCLPSMVHLEFEVTYFQGLCSSEPCKQCVDGDDSWKDRIMTPSIEDTICEQFQSIVLSNFVIDLSV
jgi:hypothetical protein